MDDVESIRAKTASPATLCPCGKVTIPKNLELTNFEEQLREIDAAIADAATFLEESPLVDSIPNLKENKARILEFSKSNKNGNELER